MAYTTQTKVEKYLGRSIDPSLSSTVTEWIAAVKLWIDNYCKKTFEAAAASDRYFDGSGEKNLIVDSFIGTPTIDIIDVDGTSLGQFASTDFYTYPLNSTEKWEIRLNGNGSWSKFPCRPKAVKISAQWGASSSVPADVEIAATKLVADLVNKNQGQADLQTVTLGDYTLSYKTIDESAKAMGIYNILDNYREITI